MLEVGQFQVMRRSGCGHCIELCKRGVDVHGWRRSNQRAEPLIVKHSVVEHKKIELNH